MRYTFKKLNEFLSLHFKDQVEFKNEYGIKTLSFGKIIEREDRESIRVFMIDNECGYILRETQKIGNYINSNSASFKTFKELSEYVINNINDLKKRSEEAGSIKDKMELIDDDKMKHLRNTLVILKLEGKFDDFYKNLSSPYMDYNCSGRSCFKFIRHPNNTEEYVINRFVYKMKYIQRTYASLRRRSFVNEYNIDLAKLAKEVMELLYERHEINLGGTVNVYFTLRFEEDICKKLEEVD